MRLHIAWQKVTNKNSNELLREFFQKGQHLFNVLPSLSLSTITPVPEIKQKKNPTVIGFVFFVSGGDEVGRSKQRLRNSEVSEFTRINAAPARRGSRRRRHGIAVQSPRKENEPDSDRVRFFCKWWR